MSSKVYVVEEKPDKTGWLIILLGAIFIAFWKLCLAFFIGVVIYHTFRLLRNAHKRAKDRHLSRREALRLRAEAENRDYLRAGIYEGQYAGATIPMTGFRMNLDNYNDGLVGWK